MAMFDWHTEGPQTNPGVATVLATTGALPAVAEYVAYIVVESDAAAALNIQHRNAADNANVTAANKQGEQRHFVAANSNRQYVMYFKTTAANERLRIIPNAAVTGNVSASIFWRKVA